MYDLDKLFLAMVEYYKGDVKRIQHFVKVHAFARLIGISEELDKTTLFTLETAAYVHDIGIKQAELKFNSANGKLQEQEGVIPADEMLSKLGFDKDVIERVKYLVAHHHSYSNIDGIDYQILVEADFLVNLYEDKSSKEAIISAKNKIFKTSKGIQLLNLMYDL